MDVDAEDVDADLDAVVEAIDRELRALGVSIPRRSPRDEFQAHRFGSWPGPFKNQGDCVSYFATGGTNPAG